MAGPESPFNRNLDRNAANWVPLSPLSFLARSARVYPEKIAVVHRELRLDYRTFYARCRRLASALAARGIGASDTVAVLAPNIPAMLEAHYGIPMTGAVLNAVNIRLDAKTVGFILNHGEAKVFLYDAALADVARAAMATANRDILAVRIDDGTLAADARPEEIEYEAFLSEGDPAYAWSLPGDEWHPIALNYTSGTTGDPKGVVYHHRGAYLNALGNAITFGLGASSAYLWTLPMFHCNGWTYTWAVTAAGGTHVCLREVDPVQIFPAIAEHRVSHMCGAPVVLNMLVHAPSSVKRRFEHVVEVATGGAAPPSAVIRAMETMGFRVTHLYGMTESYGPSTVCAPQPGWEGVPVEERASLMARQGVGYLTLEGQRVADPETMTDVPADATTVGELMLRGNTVMRGYLKNPAATEAAFRNGRLHTGDLAVVHPDGYVEIKDRAKDIIISGGENISSLEVEEVLYRHPAIMEAAVVAAPHQKWGETPCAFVTLKNEANAVGERDVIEYCRANLPHFKCPTRVVFGPLPKTSTGKIQKFVLREQARQ